MAPSSSVYPPPPLIASGKDYHELKENDLVTDNQIFAY